MAARTIQAERFSGTNLVTNAEIGPRELEAHATLDATGEEPLKAAVVQLHLSA